MFQVSNNYPHTISSKTRFSPPSPLNSSLSAVQIQSQLAANTNFPVAATPTSGSIESEENKLSKKVKKSALELIPFLNEIANVIAHLKDEGKGWALEWIYQASPTKILGQVSKYTIDFISLLGIGAKGISKFDKYLKKGLDSFGASAMGLWEMSLNLIFSYIIPSFFIPGVQKFLGSKLSILDKPLGRFLTGGIIGIGSLEIGLKLFSKFLTPIFERFIIWLENKLKP